jgi:hypothetical protein
MHGDQPAAKPRPTRNDTQSDCLRGVACTRLSIMSAGILSTPIICRPSTTMMTPPKISTSRLLFAKTPPMALAERPMATKMTVKPATKASAWAKTRAFACELDSLLRSSRLVPVRKDRYDGTSGRTQGDTNDTSPARNAVATLSWCTHSSTTTCGGGLAPEAREEAPRRLGSAGPDAFS